MPIIQPVLRVEIDPSRPVPEVCAVIQALAPYHPGQEDAILTGIREAIDRRLSQLKGDDKHG